MLPNIDAWIRRQPLAGKLTLAVLSTSAVTIVLACTVILAFDYRTSRLALLDDVTAAADMAADGSVSPMLFQDGTAAEHALAALSHSSAIVCATLYRPDGAPFAAWCNAEHATSSDTRIMAGDVEFGKASLRIRRPVMLNAERLGTIVVEANTSSLWTRLQRFALLMAFIFVGTAWISIAFSRKAAHLICDPIANLLGVTRKLLATRNYDLRVARTTADEVGDLVDSFNELLAKIHRRDAALVAQQRTLEDMVDQRTAELLQANHDVAEARDRALDSSKAKSEFLANMSHEIRTPMNGVIGMTDLLMDLDLTPEERECAETIRSSADSLLTLINDILDFSKIEAGRMAIEPIPFDLQAVIEDSVKLLSPRATARGLEVIVTWPADAPHDVIGDPGRVRQIITNLVGNAIKFTDHGHVAVETKCQDGTQDDLLFEITVEDTGIGIASDALPTLFEKFTQADASTTRKYGGTGLGLAISKQLAELMGGTITVTSQVGRGTTFRLVLPLRATRAVVQPSPASRSRAVESAVEVEADRHARTPIGGGPARRTVPAARADVLLVEDNPINQKVAVRTLERFGCRVDVAANGREAVAMVAQRSYDMIFMDCQMPEMDGYEATGLIRRGTTPARAIPIIAMTAHAMEGARARCLDAGMDDYLSKPMTLEQIRAMVNRWVPVRDDLSDKPEAPPSATRQAS